MKWFKHDAEANADAKLMKVRHKYGMVGYGLYWYCLECIARKVSAHNITFELEHDAETIATEWGLDQIKVEEIMTFMVSLGLFEESNGRISCLKMAFRLDDTNAKTPEIKNIQTLIRNNSEKLRETPRNSAQNRLDKNRLECIGDKSPNTQKFQKPSIQQLADYIAEKNYSVDAERFWHHYESVGWKIGKSPMKSWKSAVATWNRGNQERNPTDIEMLYR